MRAFRKFYDERPLLVIMIVAIALRLLAAVFAKGYGMHDDHFGPIEQPYEIMRDPSIWENRGNPHGHSIVYPLAHYVIFSALESVGIADPQAKMYVVRVVHAFYSLLIVLFGYLIALRISGKEAARLTGWLLAAFWILPFMSVRNLIEMVTIPPLMAGFYVALRDDKSRSRWLLAGALFALSWVFRYQTMIIPAVLFFILGFRRQFREMGLLATGFFAAAVLVQGAADIFAWGYPFASFYTYFFYNAGHSGDYTTGPFYQYLLLIIGLLIPPTSFMLLYGFGRVWRRHLDIWLPVVAFFVFHSIFPNKQERFILPVIPLIIMLSAVGWTEFTREREIGKNWRAAFRSAWRWFWAVNIVLLAIFTFTYSKKTRVEPLYLLSQKHDVAAVAIVPGEVGWFFIPEYYLNKNVPVYNLTGSGDAADLAAQLAESGRKMPNYFIFYGMRDVEGRVDEFEREMNIDLVEVKKISPSLIDDILYMLNPEHNVNQTARIYRVK
ncbi:MAG: glycosyltransferase family 39 protein [Candidatus Kapaibacterium sp.]